MSKVTFKSNPVSLTGNFPSIGDTIANVSLTDNKLQDRSLDDYKTELILLNIFPSIDTQICADSVRVFNIKAASLPNCKVLCISKDLPFAQSRFCAAENIANVETLSAFRNSDFGQQLGVQISDGVVKGLFARAIVILNQQRKVLYTQLVSEITDKPNYDECLEHLADL